MEQSQARSFLPSFRLSFTSDHIVCHGFPIIPRTDKAQTILDYVRGTKTLAYRTAQGIPEEMRQIDCLKRDTNQI